MVPINKTANYIQLAIGLIPTLLSVLFLVRRSGLLLFFCILSLFVIVGAVPLFKKRESLWMFIFVAVAGLPINICLSYFLISEDFIGSGFWVGNILWGVLLCCVFFSVEEIVFGIVTRLIWRKQIRIKI